MLKRILISLLLFLLVGIGIGIWFIKQSLFQLTEWEYSTPKTITEIQERPNVLLLVAEDMSDLVGAFGDTLAHTPNLDKLAKVSVRYPNTFTTAGVCSPSRAALITGMHQIAMGGQHMRTSTRPDGAYKCVPPPEVKAFPELLRQAGYFTFNTAKQDYQFSGVQPGTGPFTIWDEENNPNLWRNRKAGQPFFGMMNFMETHESGVFTPLGHRPNSAIHFILQVIRYLGQPNHIEKVSMNPDEIVPPPYFPNTPTVRQDIARHYENISVMDAIVGDILERLEKDDVLKNTIVIWTTDHGDGLPRAKRELYDSGIKVPMLVYYPPKFRPQGIKEGTVNTRMISFIDLAPTILSFTQTEIPLYMQGRDFVKDSTQQYIFASRDRIDEIEDRQRAVRNHRYKYIKSWYPQQAGGHPLAFRDNLEMMRELWQLKASNQLNETQLQWFQPPGTERLFDTQHDPYELTDLSQDTAYADILTEMRTALTEWLATTEDWSEMTENEMVEQFQRKGETRVTPKPTIELHNGLIEIKAIEGASIGYQINGGAWQLYHQPIEAVDVESFDAKAVRYGWDESEVVVFEVE